MVKASIALIGFMGTGKSTISKNLSKRLNLKLIDTDKAIEEKMDLTIAEIFKEYGEDGFRDLESHVIEGLKDEKETIISCGGGVCLKKENIINLRKNHKVILLEASSKMILKRVKEDSNRPVLKGKMDIDSIEKIMKIRKPSYKRCAHITIDTDDKTVLQIVDEIIEKLKL